MIESEYVICSKCGKRSSYYTRYCDACGTALFLPLDEENIKDKPFIDIYNSIYSLLISKNNPLRWKYLIEQDNELMLERTRSIFESYLRSNIFSSSFNSMQYSKLNNAIQNVASSVNTCIMSGYAFRVAETLFSGKRATSITNHEYQILLQKYREKAREDQSIIQTDNELEQFTLTLCAGLCPANMFLMNEETVNEFAMSFIEENYQICYDLRMQYYEVLMDSKKKATSEVEKRSKEIADEVQGDFLFGYYLKVATDIRPEE